MAGPGLGDVIRLAIRDDTGRGRWGQAGRKTQPNCQASQTVSAGHRVLVLFSVKMPLLFFFPHSFRPTKTITMAERRRQPPPISIDHVEDDHDDKSTGTPREWKM